MAGKTRTQTPKRRRSSSAAGLVDERLSAMVGKKLTVPQGVFPKEQIPKGSKGWSAIVTGVDHSHADHLFVAFPGWSEQYFFPASEVEKWMGVQEDGSTSEDDSEFELDLDAPPSDLPAPGPSSLPPKNKLTTTPSGAAAGKQAPESQVKKSGAASSGRKPAAAAAGKPSTKSVRSKRKAEDEEEEKVEEEEIQPQGEGSGGSKKVEVEKTGKEEAVRPAQRPRREESAAVAAAPQRGIIGKASSFLKELALASGSVALAYYGQIYLKQNMGGASMDPFMESAPVEFMTEPPQLI